MVHVPMDINILAYGLISSRIICFRYMSYSGILFTPPRKYVLDARPKESPMLRSILTGKLVVLLSFVLLCSVAALAQFRTVTVQNAPNNPVPTTTTIQNTSPIPMTIQNTDPISTIINGTVNAAITNVPSVNVANTVPVAVSNTVTANIANVPSVNVNGTVPVAVGNTVNANITNVPAVSINGTVPVAVGNTVTADIANVPTVNINGTVPVAVTNTANAAIVNVPTVNVNGTVPVAVNNTVTANIANVPSVNVNGTVPISGNVGITGTPSVVVSNLPLATVGTAGTTVVLVKNVDTTTLVQQVFQQSLSCSTSSGMASNCTATFNVPAGKQLMVEYLQVVSTGNVTNGMQHFEFQTTVSGQAQTYLYGPGNKLLSDTASDDHVVRIYADPGSTVQLTGVQGMAGPGITFNLLLSGHLIDVQ